MIDMTRSPRSGHPAIRRALALLALTLATLAPLCARAENETPEQLFTKGATALSRGEYAGMVVNA